jgi:hypothetical protein
MMRHQIDPGAMKMSGRLTKPGPRCKSSALALAAAIFSTSPLADAAETMTPSALRDCVRAAVTAAGVAACEARHQQWLRERIETLTGTLRTQLPPAQHPLLDRNVAAWNSYFDQEVELLDLTLKARSDGLASRLRPGVISRLLEQRERQLREYVHNLK